MAFQTVKCPHCGKTSMEYMDPEARIKCEGCKKKFEPFVHLKQTTVKKAIPPIQHIPVQEPPVKEEPPADKIFASVKSIMQLIDDCLKEEWFSKAEERILIQIKDQLTTLFNTICNVIDYSSQGIEATLATHYTYATLSARPQKLELILTYMYGGIYQLQDRCVKMLFVEYGHDMIAKQLLEANKAKIAQLIKN